MRGLALAVGFTCLGLAVMLALYRLLIGPSPTDRILALGTLTINAIVLFGVARDTALDFEAALLLATVGFVGTVAYCRFLLRGDIVE